MQCGKGALKQRKTCSILPCSVHYESGIYTGFGLALVTVSVSIYATVMATEENYGKTVSRMTMASQLGGLAFGVVPGFLADRTGSYLPSFVIMLVLTVAAAVILTSGFGLLLKRSGQRT